MDSNWNKIWTGATAGLICAIMLSFSLSSVRNFVIELLGGVPSENAQIMDENLYIDTVWYTEMRISNHECIVTAREIANQLGYDSKVHGFEVTSRFQEKTRNEALFYSLCLPSDNETKTHYFASITARDQTGKKRAQAVRLAVRDAFKGKN